MVVSSAMGAASAVAAKVRSARRENFIATSRIIGCRAGAVCVFKYFKYKGVTGRDRRVEGRSVVLKVEGRQQDMDASRVMSRI